MKRHVEGPGRVEKDTHEVLKTLRVDTAKQWKEVDDGWKSLQKRMVALGVRPPNDEETTVCLNIGGSYVRDFQRSALSRASDPFSSTLSAILVVVWGEILPQDADGRLFVDVSPEYVQEFSSALLWEFRRMAGYKRFCDTGSVAEGCNMPSLETVSITTGSTVLGPGDVAFLFRLLDSGCRGKPRALSILYRASEDGYSAKSFQSQCGNVFPTITLVRVSNTHKVYAQGRRNPSNDAIVGGFCDVSWAPEKGVSKSSANPFIFMLRDDTGKEEQCHRHAQPWGLTETWHTDNRIMAVEYTPDGPSFGSFDLKVNLSDKRICCGGDNMNIYDVPMDSLEEYRSLRSKYIIDVEVYKVDFAESIETPFIDEYQVYFSKMETSFPHQASASTKYIEGKMAPLDASVTGCIQNELATLRSAQIELVQARTRLADAFQAVEDVYGSRVLAGEKDAVVELTIRGTVMTTLRSTLQACADSVLADMFNDERGPSNENTVDAQGRRILDCDLACFAKVLDVLRLRKRESWVQARRNGRGKMVGVFGAKSAYVTVNPSKRRCFDALVKMYFPGRERFVMDYIRFQ